MFKENKSLNEYTIFIVLTSYQERYIEQTIKSALEKAKYPNRISFGVLEQRIDNRFFNLSEYEKLKHIKITYPSTLELGIARTMALNLYDEEAFIFQIDAHMIFHKEWDEKIIYRYKEIYEDIKSENFIISTYPPTWVKQEDNSIYLSPFQENGSLVINYNPNPEGHIQEKTFEEIKDLEKVYNPFILAYVQKENKKYYAFSSDWKGVYSKEFEDLETTKKWLSTGYIDAGGYPKFGLDFKVNKNNKKYNEHFLFSAHYAFSTKKFFKEILLNPIIQFGGEEPTMAMRAWTRGYRFFSINDHILWHLNKGNLKDPEDRLMGPGDSLLLKHYHNKTKYSLDHVRKVLTGEILGYWGAPNKELLEQYEKTVGFNFKEFYKESDEIKTLIKNNLYF